MPTSGAGCVFLSLRQIYELWLVGLKNFISHNVLVCMNNKSSNCLPTSVWISSRNLEQQIGASFLSQLQTKSNEPKYFWSTVVYYRLVTFLWKQWAFFCFLSPIYTDFSIFVNSNTRDWQQLPLKKRDTNRWGSSPSCSAIINFEWKDNKLLSGCLVFQSSWEPPDIWII